MDPGNVLKGVGIQLWSSEIQCHNAIDEKTGRSITLSAQRFLSQQARNGTLTDSQVEAGVDAIRSACSHEAGNRLKTAGLVLLIAAGIGAAAASELYKRLLGIHVEPSHAATTPDLPSGVGLAMAVIYFAIGTGIITAIAIVAGASTVTFVVGPLVALPFVGAGWWLLRRHRHRRRHLHPAAH